MSDLREQIVKTLQGAGWPMSAERAVSNVWHIIEAELQKRDQEIERLTPQCEGCMTGSDVGVPYGGIAYAHPNCPIHGMQPEDYAAETARIQTTLNVINQLLEQTIEVLEAAPEVDNAGRECCEDCDWWLDKAKPLLDKLQALKKEGTE